LICKKDKYNPCPCGTLKWKYGDPEYEIDKFDMVVQLIKALVVSLDPDMDTIKRVWVVAEIGQAVQTIPVFFRLALGLSQTTMTNVRENKVLMPTVERCDATSKDDKMRILEKIRGMEGGIDSYDTFINCMLEVQFGRCTRLHQLSGQGGNAMAKLAQLEMDFSWNRTLSSCADLLGDPETFAKLQKLSSLKMIFRKCTKLAQLDRLGRCIYNLKNLETMNLDFGECTDLATTDGLQDLKGHKKLKNLNLSFETCSKLSSCEHLGTGVSGCKALENLIIRFASCKELHSMEHVGSALEGPEVLKLLRLSFYKCEGFETVDKGFQKGLSSLKDLENLNLHFFECKKLSSIDELGKGFNGLQNLNKLELNFHGCDRLTTIDELAKGMVHLKKLTMMNLNFFQCQQITSIERLGKTLPELKALQQLELNFRGCERLSNIDEVGKGMKLSATLVNVNLNFAGCKELSSVDELAQGLEAIKGQLVEFRLWLRETKLADQLMHEFERCQDFVDAWARTRTEIQGGGKKGCCEVQ
jgi:uncharacterized ParB-like nuclease family protein